ncbi:MAG: N-acyl homoserine lactonase family protein [Deltaproteobacteria bacterium]|nr:N-acyl homoserine lactonase family protein [Deltaproteobacteria bacterium]
MEHELVIHPLDLGKLEIEKSLLTLRSNYGSKMHVICIGWAITGDGKTVLVDSGPSCAEDATKYHWPMVKNASQQIDKALHAIGLTCEEIEIVILTHLHWDHCYYLENFPNARFYVQKAELHYAVDPLPYDRRAYEIGIAHLQPPWMKVIDRIMPIEGDVEILPGIQTIKLPGHTPGSQGVIVGTADGDWVIAGDAVPLYDNLLGNELCTILPSGINQNLFDFNKSLRKIEPYRGKILPGHDEGVFKQMRYPHNPRS